jgi:hypothetical protein
MSNDILNVKVSSFENSEGVWPMDVNLLVWLTSDKYRTEVEYIRSIKDAALQKEKKKLIPGITPSGVFSYRDTGHFTEHSGLLVFDIDPDDNDNIDFSKLKEQVSHIASVAYCGLSIRGVGCWGLVPIPKSTPEEHKKRFAALKQDFRHFGITLDISGADVTRLRYYSWDPEAYFNEDAKLYTNLITPQQKITRRPVFSNTRERVEATITKLKGIDITQDYKDWFTLAAAFANEFGDSGRSYFHAVSMSHPKYDIQDTDYLFDKCLRHNYNEVTIGSFFKIAADFGINVKAETNLYVPIVSRSARKVLQLANEDDFWKIDENEAPY